MTCPFDGVRVLELSSGVAAGFAGRLLRGYGAEVVRVPSGGAVPLTEDESEYLHAGKRTLAGEGPAVDAALTRADLVLSDLQPAALNERGVDWRAWRARRPELIIVSVTPFGLTGPYADFHATNAVSFALGGIMSLTGDESRTPLLTGGSQAQYLAGWNAFAAACVVHYARRAKGGGALVDVSAQECAAGMLEYYGPATSYGMPVFKRLGNHTRAQWGVYPCLDGWAGVFALERQIKGLFSLLDDPELEEPRFKDPLLRLEPENDEALTGKLYAFFADKTKAELLAISLETNVPFGTATTPRELLQATGLIERGFFDSVASSTGVGVTIPGRPFPGVGWRPPDQDWPDQDWEAPPSAAAAAASAGHPLEGLRPLQGVRVADLTMMWAGPFATMRLAEMGAEVIKIESPAAWDNLRTLIAQPGVAEPWNSAFYFNAYNRDKKSLTLDLAQDEGRRLLLDLLASCDVLVENYRADVLDNLGLSYDALRAAKPDLVVVSMAAFGRNGPDRQYVGFGPVIELRSGLVSLTGYGRGDDEPFKTGISYGDPVAGTAAVSAVMLGMLQRDATGQGCHVDLAQRETAAVMIGEAFVAASRGEDPVHRGCRDARFVPQGCYPCRGDDQWMVVSVRSDAEWRSLCTVVDCDELSSLSYEERRVREEELDVVISGWTSAQRPQEAMETLQACGVPAGRVMDTGAILDDPHLLRRGFWVYLPHPTMHRYKQQGVVWRIDDLGLEPRRHAPFFGEHNEEILAGRLGRSDEDLARWRAAGVISDAPINPGVG